MELNLIRLRDDVLSIQYILNDIEKWIINYLLEHKKLSLEYKDIFNAHYGISYIDLINACNTLQNINIIQLNKPEFETIYTLTDTGLALNYFENKFENNLK